MHNFARTVACLLCTSLLIAGCDATDAPLREPKPESMDGVWELITTIHGSGLKRGYGERYEFDGNRFRVIRRADGVGPWRTLTFDTTTDPKQVVGLVAGPMLRTESTEYRAIYQIVWNIYGYWELEFMMADTPGVAPPSEFPSGPDDGKHIRLSMRRVQALPNDEDLPNPYPAPDAETRRRAYYQIEPFSQGWGPYKQYHVAYHRYGSRTVRSYHWQFLLDLYDIGKLTFRGCHNVEDDHMRIVGRLAPLRHLDLHATEIGDIGLDKLRGLKNLQHLDLSMTAVSDVGIDTLLDLTKLDTVILSGSAVTSEGIEKLVEKYPRNVTVVKQKSLHRSSTGLEVVWTRSYTEPERQAAIALTRLELEVDEMFDYRLGESACQVTFRSPEIVATVGEEGETPPLVPRLPSRGSSHCFEAAAVAEHMVQLPGPTTVIIGGRDMDDSIFVALRGVSDLQRLDLARTAVTDDGVRQLKDHESLRVVDLTDAEGITNACLPDLGTLPNLEVLKLERTGVTREGAKLLENRSQLKRLELNR